MSEPNTTNAAPLVGRDALITAITTFLAGREAHVLDEIRDCLAREIDAAGPAALYVSAPGSPPPGRTGVLPARSAGPPHSPGARRSHSAA